MEKKRVVVTGMGIVSPIGNSVDTFWDNVKNQKVGIKEIDRFDASEYKAKLAAQVEDFNPADYMDPKAARRMELFCQYAVAATKQAIDQSGLDLEKEDLSYDITADVMDEIMSGTATMRVLLNQS